MKLFISIFAFLICSQLKAQTETEVFSKGDTIYVQTVSTEVVQTNSKAVEELLTKLYQQKEQLKAQTAQTEAQILSIEKTLALILAEEKRKKQ